MASVTWLLLAGVLLLVPGRRRIAAVPTGGDARVGGSCAGGSRHARRRRGRTQAQPASRGPGRSRAQLLPLAAAAASGVCAVVLAGPAHGVAVAAVGAPATWVVIGWLQRRPARARPDGGLPLALDLAAAALRAGRPLADALVLAAPAAAADTATQLGRVAGLLRLGAEPAQAWALATSEGPLAPVVPVAVRSATSGMKVAAGFERVAAELRAEHIAAAEARAQRAGVMAMAPLAACFLPSFVCLGVVPVIVGVARGVFSGLP